MWHRADDGLFSVRKGVKGREGEDRAGEGVGEKKGGIKRGRREGSEEERRAKQYGGGREEGQGGGVGGPSTHVGKKEQDPSEECNDLARQPQVVHRGAVRVWRLGGREHGGPHPAPPPSGPRSACPPTPRIYGSQGAFSLLLFPLGVGGMDTSPSCS